MSTVCSFDTVPSIESTLPFSESKRLKEHVGDVDVREGVRLVSSDEEPLIPFSHLLDNFRSTSSMVLQHASAETKIGNDESERIR